MSTIFAIAGKGGVGKTTVAALIVAALARQGARPVLAVDADPNSCLDAVLGVTVEKTVGRLREDVRGEAAAVPGMSKRELLELRLAESLAEGEDFDLISMGRPEGPGCYCYANSVLRDILGRVAGQYPFVVMDNEAGLENLSRRIAPAVDTLILVADPSRRGLGTLARLHALALEMAVSFSRLVLVVNRLRGPEPPGYAFELAAATGADGLIGLPEDAALAALDEAGQSLLGLPPDNPVAASVAALVRGLTGEAAGKPPVDGALRSG
ncbi:MAG: AAA family ATPase [Desulfovibrionaceae bacterium]|nr:AAA family ATPase [Desulfovibrionaceae bacterium]MBF0514953.1 AAA family ATPase [Desulfovibrionaceae bacterium]